jgi:hypothetical protein
MELNSFFLAYERVFVILNGGRGCLVYAKSNDKKQAGATARYAWLLFDEG